MMKKDIIKLIKNTKEHLQKLNRIKNNEAQFSKDKVNFLIEEKNNALRKNIDNKFDKLKQYNKEAGNVAKIKLNEMFSGDDKARQRYQSEVVNELQGVNDTEKLMQYYDEVKEKEPELKQFEARKVIKNKAWKNDDPVQLNNIKQKFVDDMGEKEFYLRRKIYFLV